MRRSAEGRAIQDRLDPPPEAIAHDGVADALGNRDPNPRSVPRLEREEHEQRAGPALAPALNPGEIAPSPERGIAAHDRLGSDGQAVTTLFAPRRDDLTAIFGAHALEEAVDAFAPTVVRLEGPLHGDAP
jgi:hypothetical protein